MPLRSSLRAEKILEYTAVAANALRDAAVAIQTPFLNSVCVLSSTIVIMLQVGYRTTFRPTPLRANLNAEYENSTRTIHSNSRGGPPVTLCADEFVLFGGDSISKAARGKWLSMPASFRNFMRVCTQQELGRFKRLRKGAEGRIARFSREAIASADLEMNYGVGIASALFELDVDTEQRHQEVSLSDNGSSSDAAEFTELELPAISNLTVAHEETVQVPIPSRYSPRLRKYSTEGSLSLRISSTLLLLNPAQVAILRSGGMGKATLAMATLHHPTIVEKCTVKYFISRESANTHADLVTPIGLHLCLELSRQLSKAIVHHFVQCGSCLVVLDNLETPWEPLESPWQSQVASPNSLPTRATFGFSFAPNIP
ncbi:hypothetical protein B0H14DRAFT_2617788 [Mycena olivaceomarginata]|nr:hypothetical protein B0H14DRAFT_2617788 [Mycena olivaceomarginata]